MPRAIKLARSSKPYAFCRFAPAGLKVRDFDKRTRALTIGKDKNGKPRQLTMPKVVAEFFEAQVANKLPAASIFTRTGGAAWNKDAWKHPIKDAVKAAGLPGAVSAYTLRHSVITDLIRARLPKPAGSTTFHG